jgi:hypothetical protein
MDKDAIEKEMRLYALEWLCTSTTALLLKSNGFDIEFLDAIRKQAAAGARQQALSDDPVLSDHFSAELETAVDRLLGMTKTFLEKSQILHKPSR